MASLTLAQEPERELARSIDEAKKQVESVLASAPFFSREYEWVMTGFDAPSSMARTVIREGEVVHKQYLAAPFTQGGRMGISFKVFNGCKKVSSTESILISVEGEIIEAHSRCDRVSNDPMVFLRHIDPKGGGDQDFVIKRMIITQAIDVVVDSEVMRFSTNGFPKIFRDSQDEVKNPLYYGQN